MLAALREHGAPALVAQALLRAAFPAAVAEEGGAFAGVGDLTATQSEQLTNALHSAAGRLLADAQAAGQLVMAYQPEAAHPPAVAQLLDAVLWLAEQRPAPVDAGLPAQLLEQVGRAGNSCLGGSCSRMRRPVARTSLLAGQGRWVGCCLSAHWVLQASGTPAAAPCQPVPPGAAHDATARLAHATAIRLACLHPLQITEGASNADCEGVFAWLDERTPTFKVAALGACRCCHHACVAVAASMACLPPLGAARLPPYVHVSPALFDKCAPTPTRSRPRLRGGPSSRCCAPATCCSSGSARWAGGRPAVVACSGRGATPCRGRLLSAVWQGWGSAVVASVAEVKHRAEGCCCMLLPTACSTGVVCEHQSCPLATKKRRCNTGPPIRHHPAECQRHAVRPRPAPLGQVPAPQYSSTALQLWAPILPSAERQRDAVRPALFGQVPAPHSSIAALHVLLPSAERQRHAVRSRPALLGEVPAPHGAQRRQPSGCLQHRQRDASGGGAGGKLGSFLWGTARLGSCFWGAVRLGSFLWGSRPPHVWGLLPPCLAALLRVCCSGCAKRGPALGPPHPAVQG